ncbi:MAG: hypothetical protein M9894_11210 [Planctomycetes bacterium]|nr:hypothetical protein [Planctomycetota bacterium]
MSCASVREHLPELVRGDAPPDVGAHAAGCEACARVVEGARALRGELDAWTVAPPRDDLVERALAGLAVAALARPAAGEAAVDLPPGAPGPAGRLVPFPEAARPRRRSSVEILTTTALGGGGAVSPIPPTRGQLALRLVTQAAAALLLFGVCTSFVAVFYPAMIHAVEERRLHDCQERLREVARAVVRYRHERPDAPALRGAALRAALVEGGYLDASRLVCPGPRGHDLGQNSFWAELPPPDPADPTRIPGGRPVCWDRFGNHAEGFNVVYADGRVEVVPVEDLARWMGRAGE